MSGRRRLVALLVPALLVGVSCAPSEDTSAGAGAEPTFEKIDQETFRYPEPVASVYDLVPPAEEGAPWHIVGSVLDPGTARTRGAVWQSGDGRGWEHEEVTPTEREDSEQLRAAAHVDGDMLAVGSAGEGDDADAVVWRSGGETGWTQLAPQEMGGRHEQWAFDMAVGDGGILVAGGERAWGDLRPRLWHSTDGQTWQSVDGGPEGPFSTTGQESISAITAYGEGFVAVGTERVEGQQSGVVWYSPDGIEWERVDTPTMTGETRHALLSVTAVGTTLVAGGYVADGTGQGQPVVWRSDDGISWGGASAPLPLHEGRLSTASDLVVQSLAVEGDRIIATGGAQARPHVWRSDDAGGTWEALPQLSETVFPDGVELVDGVTDGASTVAVGSEPLVIKREEDRWVNASGDSFPDGGSKPVATSVVVDGDTTLVGGYRITAQRGDEPRRYQAHVWRRQGNDHFEVIEPNPDSAVQDFDAGAIEAMATWQNGFVAVGVEDFSVASQRQLEDPSPNGMLWLSEDGQEWTRFAAAPVGLGNIEEIAQLMGPLIETGNSDALAQAAVSVAADEPLVTLPPAGGPGTRALRGVAPLGDRFVTVGSAFDDNNVDAIVARASSEGLEHEDPGLGGDGTQRLNDVCAAGNQLVAVGTTGSDGHYETAVRLRDEEGSWAEGEPEDDAFTSTGNQQAQACAASDDGYIAVGSDDRGGTLDAKIWLSEDGREWRELEAGALGGSGEQEATAVAAVPGGGWLVAGTDTSGDDAGIALWRIGNDGQVSRRDRGEPVFDGPTTMTVADVIVTPERTVVVGADVDGIGVWETATSELDR